ncbi:hypothetical protein GFL09_02990 [Pseudomonas stutzeri]|uniref:hypothetical protein n=1 Tax=Stutzerimonas stutzeri TaxID=316 RepID=UPI00190BD554|nr:hypothetical protein [Stutzerimonas stutzeri]MBK3866665.1 hypothetical protein [Stutzerimonas stutzeri]
MKADDQQAGDEPDVTMTDGGEKNAGEDPDYDDPPSPQDEPETLPDDPDIQGEDGSDEPS